VRVTDKAWLGRSSDPSTPAGIAASLGHNLFVTKGVEPTTWERFIAKIQEEGIREFLKIVGDLLTVSHGAPGAQSTVHCAQSSVHRPRTQRFSENL
jgi:hypothetical protein